MEEQADQYSLKAADLMILCKESKFEAAIKEYEGLAVRFLKGRLLQHTVKDLVLRTVLLYLAIDVLFLDISACLGCHRGRALH